MGETYATLFEKLLKRVSGLQAVLVTNRDGTEVVRVAISTYVEHSSTSSLASSYAVAAEQVNKFKQGSNKTITSFYKDRVIMHVNRAPVYLSLIAEQNVNVGLLYALVPDLVKAMSGLTTSIQNMEDD